MKIQLFSKLENKYYYGFSRAFWHFITGTIILGILIAVLIVGWSYFPPQKKKVYKQSYPTKEAYPNQVAVDIEDIKRHLPKEEAQITAIKQEAYESIGRQQIVEDRKAGIDTTDISLFKREVAKLTLMFPPDKHRQFWSGGGYYVITDQRKYKKSKSDLYRKWVQTSPPLENRVESILRANGLNSYYDMAVFMRSTTSLIRSIDSKARIDVFPQIIRFFDKDLDKTITSIKALTKIMKMYPRDNTEKAFQVNSRFLRNNPQDGIKLLNYEASILPKFFTKERFDVSNIIKDEYRSYYNYNLVGIQENTNSFIPLISKFDRKHQALSLKYFYQIYRTRNRDRIQRINEIEQSHEENIRTIEEEYLNAKALAESDFLSKKNVRSVFRGNSLKAVGIGLGGILFVTIILLLLSMVRNVNQLAEIMIETQKKNNNN